MKKQINLSDMSANDMPGAGSAKKKNLGLLVLILLVIVGGVYYFVLKPKIGAPVTENTPIDNNPAVSSGDFQMTILKEGTGEEQARPGNLVTVHYVGTFADGAKFDSSIDRGEPLTFILGVGQVIKGWDLGVLGMKIDEQRKLTIPADYAYGEKGVQDKDGNYIIPQNATLMFEVELIALNTPPVDTGATSTEETSAETNTAN